jgi:signal transduction histidine kinase
MKRNIPIRNAQFAWMLGLFFVIPLLSNAQNDDKKQTSHNFDLLRNQGYDFEDFNQLDSATYYYSEALNVAIEAKSDYNLATIYTDLAIISRKKADYVSCKNFHEKALLLAEKTGDKDMIEGNLHGFGSLYEQIGDYEKAAEYYLKSLRLSQDRGEKEGSIPTLQNISKIYMFLNIKDLAINNIEQASQIAAETKNDSLVANVLHDYGEILVHFGENEKALKQLNAAHNTYEKLKHNRFIGSSLVYLGEVYSRMNNLPMTMSCFKNALKYKEAMDKDVLSDLYFKMGTKQQQIGKRKEAEDNFLWSYQLAKEYEFKDLEQKSAHSLYQIYKFEDKQAAALQYLQISSGLSDEIFNVQKTKHIAEMQLKYDNEKQQRAFQALELQQYQWILASSVLIFSLVIGFLAYIARMSDRNNRMLESKNREIQMQNTQLTESNDVLRQYAYVAAHDLKEPLRTICSFINLLEIKFGKKIEDPQAVEYMQFISNSAKRMNILLSDLLEYSSIFHQQKGADEVNPNSTIDEVCINLRTLIENNDAQVLYNQEFPTLAINRMHLVQILQNLVGNALKFTSRERRSLVEISSKIEGKEIVFAVKDNGIGISDKHREKIFNLFFRAHETTNEYEGTGIGLSICKSLTEKYGGRVWFQSIDNQGTTFFFSFPKELIIKKDLNAVSLKKQTA